MFNLFNNQSSCFKAIYFLQIFYQTLYIYTFIIFLNILSSRIWGDFPPLHLLGFGRFSAIPSFHHSITLCYRVALHSWHATYASVNSTCAQPPGYCRVFAHLVSPGGGAFANFALPGGRAFANPRAIPELLTRTRFPIKNRNKLQRVVKACFWFYLDVCISSLLIKPELHSEIGAIDVNQRFLVIESNFCWYYVKNTKHKTIHNI